MDIWNEAQVFEGNNLALSFGDHYYFGIMKKKIN